MNLIKRVTAFKQNKRVDIGNFMCTVKHSSQIDTSPRDAMRCDVAGIELFHRVT